MSLKDMIEYWNLGVEHALQGSYQEALDVFTEISEPGARIYFNMSSAFLRLGNLEQAEKNLNLAVKQDQHFALAYFQRGCLQLQKRRHEEAMQNFDTAMKTMRGNLLIDYKQLGLHYKLYSCEVMYNRAYTHAECGRSSRAVEELETARGAAAQTSESRHKIINAALESVRAGKSFLPYRLPKTSIFFTPPRSKTQVLTPFNFMGKAKVLSSIVDQDAYTGFVGVQDRSRSPSPSPRGGRSPGRRRSPSPARHTGGGKSPPNRPTGRAPRVPKPDIPPPAPNMKMPSRKASLRAEQTAAPFILPKRGSANSLLSKPRPPKPDIAPPPPHSAGRKFTPPDSKNLYSKAPLRPTKSHELTPSGKPRSPLPSRSPSPNESMMTVKVHYTTTRALRMSVDVSLDKLTRLVCKKFGQSDASLVLWCKRRSGELTELSGDSDLKEATQGLEDGFRLTLWAYDHHKPGVLKEVLALYDYEAQFEDELSFTGGDAIHITAEVNAEWYRGTCHGNEGMLPKSFVKDA